MRAVIPLLVLLFSMCGAQTRSTGAAAAAVTEQVDISAELRELRDIVMEQRVQLTVTQNELLNTQILLHKMEDELNKTEDELVNLRKETAAQETRLSVTETDMEHVKKDTAAQHTELTTMKTEVMNLIKENAAQETEMVNLKMETAAELTAVKTRLAATETEVVNLEKEITEQPKVAFSAGLGGSILSGNTDVNLVFTNIITNVGQAYSNTTGFFTAPVRGVYYFRFTVMDNLASHYMTISMFKNGEQIMWLDVYDTDGQNTYVSSGATLQLEEGDVVNLGIPAGGYRLFDNGDNHCTFSGFLLFAL